ncbi:MAG: methylenetetrahydrofolate--tRNA-(uracil(54)-C(5))-methyltransferase (FADH(2)-oxidizing) TrmFO [Anaeroplasmataceae bacterium]|nr:methylenetetrahydrofolate--tRNA-(uracil(54)-C(5))-methyltransferase (FADH(2)-oxidizing) TrmFO [Anaeroplasmataceae bacterium]MDE5868272.1 methylenetetrahydrofolate--tRNA-(uracil(54)-C(5))-methyltransferase (FADH(2)-oxidizing) TrmFO [Anaeroplasmataceae bacterium]
MMKVKIIGAGLAGCEAAYYLAKKGYEIDLYEMRPVKMTPAHKTEQFGELVCSNSLRSDSLENACGILKKEMEMFDSLIIKTAREHKVEAGGALAVDREGYSEAVTKTIQSFPNIHIYHEEVTHIDVTIPTIIATGPLTTEGLGAHIKELFGCDDYYFFDAQAPIIYADSINYDKVYLKSRYDKGVASYYNCPFTKEEFDSFYNALITAEGVEVKDFEIKVFEGCMPIEIMAKRGPQTLTFGPMKPVGLKKPDGTKPYAVVQLRQDDAAKQMYNLVGFQTHLKFGEQKRVFQMIPGLENARFAKYGRMHKNTYINAPKILNPTFQTKQYPNVFFAGQISGVEGYVESAASGIVAGINMDRYLSSKKLVTFPSSTVMGSMANYICSASIDGFQPMNANFGIMSDLSIPHKKSERKALYAKRALEDMKVVKDNL